jgi:hypothetical protein
VCRRTLDERLCCCTFVYVPLCIYTVVCCVYIHRCVYIPLCVAVRWMNVCVVVCLYIYGSVYIYRRVLCVYIPLCVVCIYTVVRCRTLDERLCCCTFVLVLRALG